MELLPTHQILEDGKLIKSFTALLDRRNLTFRSTPEVAEKLKVLILNWCPDFDFGDHVYLGNEHGIPCHMETLHMFIHPTLHARGTECYIRLVEKSALIVE